MPIHILSVLNPPKGVYAALSSIFSNFLWGAGEEVKKRKWVAWSRICLPVEEGGLGIRDLSEVQSSLFMKFAWKLLVGKSLWAEFFRHKYVRDAHPASVCNQRGTRFWKGVMAVLPLLIMNSKYLVRGGEINFWYDNWLGDGSLADITEVRGTPTLQVRSVFINGRWDERKLREIVPTKIVSKITYSQLRVRTGSDILIWMPKPYGIFSTKSAWDIIRRRGSICPWKKWLWHKHVPKKMSFVCWRARKDALPVDELIQKLGISIAPRCNCCSCPHAENIDHVLCDGEVARRVWEYFAAIFDIRLPQRRSWQGVVNIWWLRATQSHQAGLCRGILPILITWALWRLRCASRMEDVDSNWDTVVQMVKSFLLNITVQVRKFSKLSSRDESRLKDLNCPVIPITVNPPRVIVWSKPGDRWFKLNVDGGSNGNPGPFGGGGIIRDARGHALAGFAHSYGVATNPIAEALALLDGLRMAQQRGLWNLLVESDSKVVVGWLNSGLCNLWYMWDFWEEILFLFRTLNCRIHHIYREANMVADFLAKEGANSRIMDFDGDDVGIGRLRGLLQTDYLEMPYLRR